MHTLNSEAIVALVVRTTFILTIFMAEADCFNSSSIPEGIDASLSVVSKSILLNVVLFRACC